MSDPHKPESQAHGEWEPQFQPMDQSFPSPTGPPPVYPPPHAVYGWQGPSPAPVARKKGLSSAIFLLVMVLSIGVLSSITTLAVVGGMGEAPPPANRPGVTVTGTLSGERQNLDSILDSVFTVAVRGSTAGGTGSAVAIDDKHVVTNAHVVNLGGSSKEASPTIEVQDSFGNEYPAYLVGVDPVADVAVLRVDAPKLTPIEWGDSSTLAIGQGVVAVGAPLGLSNTVTSGIISALNRPVKLGDDGATSESTDPSTYINAIQTDAAINRGNSGGPLIDTDGKLVGLNVAISSAEGSTGSIGIGYAIPVSYVKRVSKELIDSGEASHGLLDVSVITAGSSSQFFEDGALVQEIVKGGAADGSKLKKGDVIVGWNGDPVASAGSLIGFAKSSAPKSEVTLTVRRGAREIGVKVTLGSDRD